MRIPVWSHDANPSVDPRLLKQSLARCEAEVVLGSLRWLDPDDKTKGAIGTRRRASREIDEERLIAAGNMTDAWITRQSGYAGPLVLQLATS